MLALLLDPLLQLFQGFPGLNQPGDLLARGIVRLRLAVGKRLGEPGDRLGVDRIVLGQPPGRFGKAANSLRIDDQDRDADRAHGFRPAPLITAAGLHHRKAHRLARSHAANSARPSGVLDADKRRPVE